MTSWANESVQRGASWNCRRAAARRRSCPSKKGARVRRSARASRTPPMRTRSMQRSRRASTAMPPHSLPLPRGNHRARITLLQTSAPLLMLVAAYLVRRVRMRQAVV
jgi:hypothetical protein